MTTTPTASPELPNLDHLEALGRAADQGEGQHIYTNPRDSNGWQANEAWHRAASPAAVLALIALARRAQPEGEAPQAKDTPESMAQSNARFAIDGAIQYGRENRNEPPSTDHWLYEYWNIGRQLAQLGATGWDNVTPAPAATLSPLCGAQHAESEDPIGEFQAEARQEKLEEAVHGWSKHTDLSKDGFAIAAFKKWHQEVGDQDCEYTWLQAWTAAQLSPDLKKRMGDALNVTLWLYRRLPGAYGRPPFVDAALLEMAKIADIDAQGSIAERAAQQAAAPVNSVEFEGIKTSAPGTPEAPSQLMQALTTGIPLQEPVYIAKALRAQREVRVSLAGGTGPGAAAFLANIQMTPWTYTKETAEAYAWGYNRALKDYRAALLDVAAQLDGGQEGSESNG